MSSGLPVGIIGFGRIGAEHAGWIDRSGAAHVAAVFDPTPARADLARARGLPVVGSLAELFDRSQAVLVATPTRFHFDHAAAALDADKHVMVEKPMALDHAQAFALTQKTRQVRKRGSGGVLSVFHCRRWDADFLAVRALIASGRLGRVFNIESRLGQWASCVGPAAPEWHPNWRNEAAFGGGALYDWGSHFLDQLQLLLAPALPVRVFAQLRGNVWSKDCDDFARVLIDFDDGVAALCEINTTTAAPGPRWKLDGTLGSASSPHSPTFSTHEWADFTVLAPPLLNPHNSSFPALTEPQIWAAFASACLSGSEPPIAAASVLPTMRLLDAAFASARAGAAITLTES